MDVYLFLERNILLVSFTIAESGRDLPEPLTLVKNFDFKLGLSYDREFWDKADIPYSRCDQYWDDVRAGFASYCFTNFKLRLTAA